MNRNMEQVPPKGILALIKDFFDEPLPRGVSWPHALGSVLLALVAVQVVTGILLSLYYSPNAEVAYESVRYIEQQVLFGSLIRGIHYFAASAMVIVVFLHLARTFFYAAYKRPRQWTWVFGVVLLLLVLGFAFTGYLLPWDMKAYFATKVGINIAGVTPLVGRYLVRILQGGGEMGTITLARFFSLHVIVLPILLLSVVGLHLFSVRLHGPTPPWRRNDEQVEYADSFYPQQLFRDSVAAFLVIGIVLLLAAKFGAPLEDRANPSDTSYVPRPDWYFYSLFQLLKIFQGKLEVVGAIVIPGLFVAALLLLPFLDRNPARRLSQRPAAAVAGSLTAALVLLLTLWGAVEGNKARAEMAARKAPESTSPALDVTTRGDAGNGKQLFVALKCGKCHTGPTEGKNLPPGLEFSGNKYRRDWLVAYLLAPHRIRWQRKNQRPIIRMPNFELSDKEARDLAAFLLTMKEDAKFPRPEFDWAEADSEMVDSGQELMAEYGCGGCHKIGDEGQNIGPALTHVGSKLLESYMYHLIKTPQKIVPGTGMKDFKLEQEDVEDIVAYLRTLK